MKASSSAFSVLDLFTIGIGPSSSHTVGPIRAAATFASSLASVPVQVIRCDLFGSLADTGRGHGTDTAVILGFMGYDPSTVPIDEVATLLRAVEDRSELILPDGRRVGFTRKDHIIFHRGKNLGEHPNAMHFTAQAKDGSLLEEAVVYSIGRGFTLIEGENVVVESDPVEVPFPFHSAQRLLEICDTEDLAISEVVKANETAFRSWSETMARIDAVWEAMDQCIERGLRSEGVLPGGLKVWRRAKDYHQALSKTEEDDSLVVMDWVNFFALAVNEENAAGGRVVTAPTNGAAGVIPSVFRYARQFRKSPFADGQYRFFLTAGAIGSLYKKMLRFRGRMSVARARSGWRVPWRRVLGPSISVEPLVRLNLQRKLAWSTTSV